MMCRFCLMSLVLAVTASTALAQNVHLKGGANAEPSFNDGGLFLEAMGSLVGLGNGDVLISLTATANVTATCTNQGGNAAPGQNPAPLTVSGSLAIPESEIKNGTLAFAVQTIEPVSTVPGAPECPNGNWTETILDLSFTNLTITVEQPPGTPVLVVTCTVTEPTTNGALLRDRVDCVQQ